MELRSRTLPMQVQRPTCTPADEATNETHNYGVIKQTPRCLSAPYTPMERETMSGAFFSTPPRRDQANLDDDRFIQSSRFSPIRNQREVEITATYGPSGTPTIRPVPQKLDQYIAPNAHQGHNFRPGYNRDYGTGLNITTDPLTRNPHPVYSGYQQAPVYSSSVNDFKPRTPFDGKVDTWEPFMMQLGFMAKTYQWPAWKFHEQLLFSVRGEALLFASNLSPRIREDLHNLIQALEQRFGQSLLAETYSANLYNIRKSSKETLPQYSARVSQLMSRAYPRMEGTSIYNNLLIEHLLKGLPDQRLAYEVLKRKPRDMCEAVDMITWHEACRQYTMKSSDVRNLKP